MGAIDRIGSGATAEFEMGKTKSPPAPAKVDDHEQATVLTLKWLREQSLSEGLAAVGHRVVHGGERFEGPTLIDDEVISEIDALRELAPLHNGPSLAAIRAARAELGAAMKMVAVFDTSFHRSMPPVAAQYAVPREWTEAHHIRRYGFHGIAHEDMLQRSAALMGKEVTGLRLITLQLGNGCSACAIAGGRSIDTSMGFTPLEGLVMGTRSGDIDPSALVYLARRAKLSIEEIESQLNRRCGLLGVSGTSRDMRELEAAQLQGELRANLAIEMFCYRVRKYIGAYLAVLRGADAVVFGGGIGEHDVAVRARICAEMQWCGLELDPERNAAMVGTERVISSAGSKIAAIVIPVDEAVLIARETLRCISQ